MGSKALVLLGLFTVLFVFSEVAGASERQSGTVKLESEETVQPAQESYGTGGGGGSYGTGGFKGGYCRHGCCYRGYKGGYCRKCCSYAGEAVQTQTGH